MPQTLEIGSDDIEPVGSQIPIQVPSSHISIGDGPQTPKTTSFLQSLMLYPATDGTFQNQEMLHILLMQLSLPSILGQKPLISFGDALDMYHTISEKELRRS
ncbi:uncharacterized protein LOC121743440 [Salvia splendens]|uniref:uncharacterized protein LOC121743439 n=1 Tax=Salvia splendens TaxID=180675 RepID=UPI001C253E05|nr:uncharacterized protein LOC121743439 [Salvia splendens]XP_041992686.1 uncharacterized protein LOC121743439 [Salvia splendens]XP_041992688.1 uncharacterized protein LOC121743439 [Salvia splendens]XP_041992689.1 uncharacterized protein LOC121743440 [Salvia splendens]